MDSSMKNVSATQQQCVVRNCKGPKRDPQRLYRFPIQRAYASPMINSLIEKRKLSWIEAVKRKELLNDKIILQKICSDHFVTGTPSPSHEVNNLDWIPSLNLNIEDEQETNHSSELITISPVKEIISSIKTIPHPVSTKTTVPVLKSINQEKPPKSQNDIKVTPSILKSKLKPIQTITTTTMATITTTTTIAKTVTAAAATTSIAKTVTAAATTTTIGKTAIATTTMDTTTTTTIAKTVTAAAAATSIAKTVTTATTTTLPIKSTQNILSKSTSTQPPILLQNIKPLTNNYPIESLLNGNKKIRLIPVKFNGQSSIQKSTSTSTSTTPSSSSSSSIATIKLTSSATPTSTTTKPSSIFTTLISKAAAATTTTTLTTLTKPITTITNVRRLPSSQKFVQIFPKVTPSSNEKIITTSQQPPPPLTTTTTTSTTSTSATIGGQNLILKNIDFSTLKHKLMLHKKPPSTESPLSSSIIKLKNIPNLSILKTFPAKSNATNFNNNNNNRNADNAIIAGTFADIHKITGSKNLTVTKHMTVAANNKRTVLRQQIGSSAKNLTARSVIIKKPSSMQSINRPLITDNKPKIVVINGVNRYLVKKPPHCLTPSNIKLTSNNKKIIITNIKRTTGITNNNQNIITNTNSNNNNIKISNIYSGGKKVNMNSIENNSHNVSAIDFIDMTNENETDNFIDENEERIKDLFNSDDNDDIDDDDDDDDDDEDDYNNNNNNNACDDYNNNNNNNNDNDDYNNNNNDIDDDDVIFVDSQNMDTDVENDNEVALINTNMGTKPKTLTTNQLSNLKPTKQIKIKTYGKSNLNPSSTITKTQSQELHNPQTTSGISNNKTLPPVYPVILTQNSNIPKSSSSSLSSSAESNVNINLPSLTLNTITTIKPVGMSPVKITKQTMTNTNPAIITTPPTTNTINLPTVPTAIIRRCTSKSATEALPSPNSYSIPSTTTLNSSITPFENPMIGTNSNITTTDDTVTTTTTTTTTTSTITEIPEIIAHHTAPIEETIIIPDVEIPPELLLDTGEFHNSYIKIDQIIDRKLYSYKVNMQSENEFENNNLDQKQQQQQPQQQQQQQLQQSLLYNTLIAPPKSSNISTTALPYKDKELSSSTTLTAPSIIRSTSTEKRKGTITIKDYRELMDTTKIRKPNPMPTKLRTPTLAISKVVSLVRMPNSTSNIPPKVLFPNPPSIISPSITMPPPPPPSTKPSLVVGSPVIAKRLMESIRYRPFTIAKQSTVQNDAGQEEEERKKQILNSKLLRERSKQNLQNLIQMVAQRERTTVPTGVKM